MTQTLNLVHLTPKPLFHICLKSLHNNKIQISFHSSTSLPLIFRGTTISTTTHIHTHSHTSPASVSEPNKFLALLCIAAVLLSLRLAAAVILPDFPARWRNLIAHSAGEAYPAHLWKAVVACEDRRFFDHFGLDPAGIARAVASLSARGGGSTITQQLVKNAFLKNERTLSRKLVEMVLSVALEKKMSKQSILSCYVNKIYWGHGIYGIESASKFYFGKHPSLLTLGESALLAGIIPAPELRSPFKNLTRGKTHQARVLKKMVDVGFLDIETALSVLKQPLSYVARPPSIDCLSQSSPLFKEEDRGWRRLTQARIENPALNSVWDWETESKMWETYEWLESWAIGKRNPVAQQAHSNNKLVKR